jgi:hypothetical protein
VTVHREGGLWVAPIPVAGELHVFAVDALRSAEGVGGWLSEAAICTTVNLAVGARLATKEQALTEPMCDGCWLWLLTHPWANLIYSPPGDSSIVEPEAVGLADLGALGWRGDA